MSTERCSRTRGAGVALALVLGYACSRQADLPEPPEAITVPTAAPPEAGDVITLDTGLSSDAYAACGERPEGNCRGPIDFTCQWSDWVRELAGECQLMAGCEANGWIRAAVGNDGCATEFGMDQPNDAFVACMADALGSARCPCAAIDTEYWLGEGNTGPCPDGGVHGRVIPPLSR